MLRRYPRSSKTGQEPQLDLDRIDLVVAIAEDIDNCLDRGDLFGAIFQIERAILLCPDSANLYADLANSHSQIGNIQQAIANYDRAIELDPTNKSLQHWRNELDDWTWDLELLNPDNIELEREIEEVCERNVSLLLDNLNYDR
jgi:tetratricopeptide (TPR) repeat protein